MFLRFTHRKEINGSLVDTPKPYYQDYMDDLFILCTYGSTIYFKNQYVLLIFNEIIRIFLASYTHDSLHSSFHSEL
jgi:hypothetical protein